MAKNSTEEAAIAAGGVALVASILGNLKQNADNTKLTRSVEALQGLVADWQRAHAVLNAQLELALRTNDEQNRMIAMLREELRQAQTRAYAAEQRALEAEAAAAPKEGQ